MGEQLKYKEYKTEQSLVLFNIDTFTYCNGAICKLSTDLNFIEVSQEDAELYKQKYYEETLKKEEEEHFGTGNKEEIYENQHGMLKSTKTIKTVFTKSDPMQEIKDFLIEELKDKGYNTKELVQPIIHE